jgi:copper(I)-binding protein
MQRELTLFPLVALLAVAACGGSGDAVSIDAPWARTSPTATDRGAVYFEISADADDTLLGVSVDASVAADAQIHEMVVADMTGMDDADARDDMDGEAGSEMDMDDDTDEMAEMAEMPMMMQEVADGLALPAGDEVTLEPGSYHVMLLDLVEPLETGGSFELTLDFANADDVTIEVPVRETAP